MVCKPLSRKGLNDLSQSLQAVIQKIFKNQAILYNESAIISDLYKAINTSDDAVARDNLLKVADKILKQTKKHRSAT